MERCLNLQHYVFSVVFTKSLYSTENEWTVGDRLRDVLKFFFAL